MVFDAPGHRHRRLILSGRIERSTRDVDRLLPFDGDVELDRDRLVVEVRQDHLPTREDDGFVEWDGRCRVGRGET